MTNSQQNKPKKKMSEADTISIFGGLFIAVIIFQMGSFGLIPAFIIAMGSCWIVKKIAQSFSKEEEEEENLQESKSIHSNIIKEHTRGVPLNEYIAKHYEDIEYFSVSLRKFAILSVTTFGLYELYWFYKNWKAVRDRGKEKISPFWRTVFLFIFALGLFERVLSSSKKVGYKRGYNPLVLLVIYLIFLWIGRDSLLFYFFSFLPLLKVQETINFNNSKIIIDYKKNDKFTTNEIIISVVGGIFVILTIIGFFS